jgi:hypothetical protein
MSRRYRVMFRIRVHGQHIMSTYPERTPLTPPAWEPPASPASSSPRGRPPRKGPRERRPHERVLCSSHFLGRRGRVVKEVHETAGGVQWGTLARGTAGGSARGGEVTPDCAGAARAGPGASGAHAWPTWARRGRTTARAWVTQCLADAMSLGSRIVRSASVRATRSPDDDCKE